MIETTLEEATVEFLTDADVVMAVGMGDRHMSHVLLGRKTFASIAGNPTRIAASKIVRVRVTNEEELGDLKNRVRTAQGKLDPDVE